MCVPFVPLNEDLDSLSDVCADSAALIHDILLAVGRASGGTVGVECVMLYAQGYSYGEIATMVGINLGTVKSRISTGRAAIRHALGL